MALQSDPEKTGRALSWITSLLRECGVPFQAVGGLAAQAYGARRPLVDIDLYAPFDQAAEAIERMQPFIVRAPGPHRSESWDLVYLAMFYEDVEIEIGDSSTDPKFYNVIDQRWAPQIIDFEASEMRTVYGVEIPVMPKDELIRYKRMLDREVDHMDIREISD